MFKKSGVTKHRSVVFFSVLLVSFCFIGVAIQQYVSSSRVVLKDELQIHRKLLHNAAGEHACDCWKPIITTVAISAITSTGASITWNCDAPSSYQVKYGTTTAKDKYFPATPPTAPYKVYTVVVTGLTPNTLYHVGPSSICISSCGNNVQNIRREIDKAGKNDWTFTTLPATSITVNQNENSPTSISEAGVAEVTAQDVTILWKTNNPATSVVEYGLTTAYGSKSAENFMFERNHTIQLFELKLGATYHARAVSKTSTGATVYSSDFTFTTPIAENRIVNSSTVLNEPNPCFDRTTFVYYLFQPTKRITIDISTLSGKTVASLEVPQSAMKGNEYNKVLWDVRDNAQKRLATGLYVYSMKFYTANNQVEVMNSNLMVRK